jgi:hypothetical protein
MTKDIVGKLTEHLRKPVDNEPSVLYLLAQVRKLLDRDDKADGNETLWMYCHWALHVDLTLPKTTMNFLKCVDRWITNTIAYLTPSGPWTFHEECNLFRDFTFLSTFRQQLGDLLNSYGLQTDLCEVDKKWYAFVEAYGGIIEDGTLSTKADKQNELGAVKQVTFAKGETLTSDHHVSFVIQWNIELKDGRIVKTDVETVPAGKMTSYGLQVVNGKFLPPLEPPQLT